jgi:aminopeptidase N
MFGRWGSRLVFICAYSCAHEPSINAHSPGETRPGRTKLSVLTPNKTPTVPPPQEVDWDSCGIGDTVEVLNHDVDLSVTLEPPHLSGSGKLRLRARGEGAQVTLDTRGLSVTSAALLGRAVQFKQTAEFVCIALNEPFTSGTELELELVWTVPLEAGKMPRFSATQMWAGYRASAWMPTLQDPAQRATLDLRISADSTLKVAGSGRRLEAVSAAEGQTTHHFVLERPTPPFLYAFVVGQFSEAELRKDGVTFRAFGPAAQDPALALQVTAEAHRLFATRLGIPMPADEYVQVFVDDPEAAQEAAGLAFVGVDSLKDLKQNPSGEWIFSHELAHQWFGWLAPCADFRDFWLNEGFATFLVGVVKEQRWGASAYAKEVELWRTRSQAVHEQGRDAPVSLARAGTVGGRLSEADLQARGVTYSRGALVLHKLRSELGEGVFWRGAAAYLRSGSGTSEGLRQALERESGRSLQAFFERWVYASAHDL